MNSGYESHSIDYFGNVERKANALNMVKVDAEQSPMNNSQRLRSRAAPVENESDLSLPIRNCRRITEQELAKIQQAFLPQAERALLSDRLKKSRPNLQDTFYALKPLK